MSIARRRLLPAGIVILAIAVLVCLSLGAAGGHDMQWATTALVCCFLLAVVTAALLLEQPVRSLEDDAAVAQHPRTIRRRLFPVARPPDPVSLGALLI